MTCRAPRRQRDVDCAVDPLRWWYGSVTRRVSGLSPRSLGVSLGRPFGEGGSLPLAGAPGLLEFLLEVLDLGAERFDDPGLSPGQVDQFLVSWWRAVHGRCFTRQQGEDATVRRSVTR